MNTEAIAERKTRLAELIFQWLAIAILMVVVGFGVQFWSYGGPGPNLSSAEWLGRAIGMTIGFSAIPMYVAAWTHMKRPWLVLLTWLPIGVLSSFGAVMLHDQRTQTPVATAYQSSGTVPGNSAAAQVAWDGQQSGASSQSSESAQWNSDVQDIFREHPVLNYGNNAKIFQEKLYQVAKPGMTNQDMLQLAYYATTTDRRWSQTP